MTDFPRSTIHLFSLFVRYKYLFACNMTFLRFHLSQSLELHEKEVFTQLMKQRPKLCI